VGDCIAEPSAHQPVDSPRGAAHDRGRGGALEEADRDGLEGEVAVLLAEERVEDEEREEAGDGVGDGDAALAEVQTRARVKPRLRPTMAALTLTGVRVSFFA
jgi:hypothetical protein